MARSKKTSDKKAGTDKGDTAKEASPATPPEGEIEDAVVISESAPEGAKDAAAADTEGDAKQEPPTEEPEAEAEDLPEIADYVEGAETSDPVEEPALVEASSDETTDDAEGEKPSGDGAEATSEEGDSQTEAEEASKSEDAEAIEGETFMMTPGEEEAPDDTSRSDEDAEIHVPATTVAADNTDTPPQRSPVPVFAAIVLGGAVAGLIGYGVAVSTQAPAPVADPGMSAETRAAMAEQSDRLSALEAQSEMAVMPETVQQAVAPVAETVQGFDTRLSDLEKTISDLDDRVATLADRVETIAMRPESTGIDPAEFDQAITEFRQQLESAVQNAQVEIDQARKEAERISEEAFQSEKSAKARAAWREVITALQSGAPYEAPLAEVAPMLDGPVPDVLASQAATGLPTLADLQARFPEAARSAIADATRENVGDGAVDRLTSFFKVQTGYRSLEPHAGDDADAVLSRAEAALKAGDLTGALAEVAALDGPAAAAMTNWTEAAQARVSALDAASEISGRLLQ